MKNLIIKLIVFISVLFIPFKTVSALENVSAGISCNKYNVHAGDKVKVTLNINELNGITKGLGALKANIEYDSKVFRDVSESDFTTTNQWESLKYNYDTKEFVLFNRVGMKSNGSVLTLTLNVKKNAKIGTTIIIFKDIVTSEGKKDLFLDDKNISIAVIKDVSIIPNSSSYNTQVDKDTTKETVSQMENINKRSIANSISQIENIDKKPSTKKKIDDKYDKTNKNSSVKNAENVPRTRHYYVYLFIIISIIIGLLIYLYIKRRNSDKTGYKSYITLFIIGTTFISFSTSICALALNFAMMGDVNGDSVVNYNDAYSLEHHLIHLKNIESKYLENADMNSSKNITVTDLVLLIQKLEKTLDYKVTFANKDLDRYFYKKNENVTLRFIADVSYNSYVKNIVINGKNYTATRVENGNNEYELTLPVGNTAGIKNFVFEKVILENEKEVDVNYSIKVEVIKEKPIFENYSVEEDINSGKLYIAFDIIDKDSSMTSGNIVVYNDKQEKVLEELIRTNDKNSYRFTVPAKDEIVYKANIDIYYECASKEFANNSEYNGSFLINKELKFNTDYQFVLSTPTITKDGKNISIIEKNTPLQVEFVSSNTTIHEPTSVTINGKEYSTITKNGTKYSVLVNGLNHLGDNQLKIEEVVIANGKRFKIVNDNTMNIRVIKRKPSIGDFTSSEDIKDETMNVSIEIHDEDAAISRVKIYLLNDRGEEISSYFLKDDEIGNNMDISKNLNTAITSNYTVKVDVAYKQSESDLEKVETLLLRQVKAKPRTTIREIKTDSKYYEKGSLATIAYDIVTNKAENASKVVIENVEVPLQKLENGKYIAQFIIPNVSGKVNLTTSKVIYSDGSLSNVSEVTEVEVLKAKPQLTITKQEDNIRDGSVTITYKLDDLDNAFISGKAVLISNDDVTNVVEKEITADSNKVTFNILEDKVYTLNMIVLYDRDTKTSGEYYEENRKEEILAIQRVHVISDYQLTVGNIKTSNMGLEASYFGKNQNIGVSFASQNRSEFTPIRVRINGKNYDLIKEGELYKTVIDGFDSPGGKEIVLEKITLSNLKTIDLEQNNKVKVDILKQKLKLDDFNYMENDDATIEAKFNISDLEKSFVSGIIQVFNDKGEILKTQEVKPNENKIAFNKILTEYYTMKVYVSYDLDSNYLGMGLNEINNELMLDEEINLNARAIEIKGIKGVSLFKETNNEIERLSTVPINDLNNLSNYYLKLEMENARSFHADIRDYKIKDNKLYFVVNYDNVVQYSGKNKSKQLEVLYGDVTGKEAQNVDLETLVKMIKENPTGNYKLTMDSDATNFVSGNSVIPEEFSGTIDFGNHTIKNLSRPLFSTLRGATIKNLVISDSAATAHGIFANSIKNSTISNVHLRNVSVSAPDEAGTGSFAGRTEENTVIKNCSATNVTVGSRKRTGGFIGQSYLTSFTNCYLSGTVSSNSDGSGGFIGEVPSSLVTLENVYVNIKTSFGGGSNAGLVGWSRNLSIVNTLSKIKNTTSGKPYAIYGSALNGNSSSNNYEVEEATVISQASHAKITKVEEENIKNIDFYTKTLGWSEDVWDFSGVENGDMPTLKSMPKQENSTTSGNIVETIPGYNRLKQLSNYNKNKEIAYYNMYRLMPFYDAKYYIEDGNKIASSHILNTKVISYIFAYDENGKRVGALTDVTKGSIKSIRILFDDNDSIIYPVAYQDDNKKIVNYSIGDLNIGYTFEKYIVNTNSRIYKYIVDKVKNSNYVDDIATLTSENEVRNYTEFYPLVQKNAEEFALNLLANVEDYNLSIENETLEKQIIKSFETDRKLDKIIYAYNYFNRFYNFEIGGINMRDFIFFDGTLFHKSFNPIYMSGIVVDRASTSQRGTNQAEYGMYNNYIKSLAGGRTLGNFLEYFIKNLTNDKYKDDPASWIIDNFRGTIYEAPAPNHKNLRYRVWDHIKAREGDGNLLLSILSYPEDDLYVLGIPTCLLVGGLNKPYYRQTHWGNRPFENISKEERLSLLKEFAGQATNFYDSLAGITLKGPGYEEGKDEDGNTVIKSYGQGYRAMVARTMLNYDGTQGSDWPSRPDAPPIYKYFSEAMGKWFASNMYGYASAYANGTDIYWAYDVLKFYNIYTHEAIHNQDGNTVLEGKGRRGNGEYYTDGFLTQGPGNASMFPNYSSNNSMERDMYVNFTVDRVNTREEIDDYYKKMYDVIAILDYLESQAFLRLTPEEQSKVGKVLNGVNTREVSAKTADDFKNMNLKTMEDLWDNSVVIRRLDLVDGSEWRIPYQENGILGKGYFIVVAYQMLGSFGYTGYTDYAGGKWGNDLNALRAASGDPNMTFKAYQLGRYEQAKENAKKMPYLNVDGMINELEKAMKEDIANNHTADSASLARSIRRRFYGYVKRATNDFRDNIYGELKSVRVNSAQELVNLINEKNNRNIILGADLDFAGIEVTGNTVLGNFMGTIDGNGHTIKGLSKPLFNVVLYSNIKNLKFVDSAIVATTDKAGALAREVNSSTVSNIVVKNVSASGPSNVASFAGTINTTTVSDVTFEGVQIQVNGNGNNFGGFIASADYATFKNVHGRETTINGKDNVGGILGYGNFVQSFKESSFNGNVNAMQNSTGGLVGSLRNADINNCYTAGTVTGGGYIGGFVGNAANIRVNKSFSAASVRSNNSTQAGAFIGFLGNGASGKTFDSAVTNTVVLGSIINGYKFVGMVDAVTIENNFSNNFELEETLGISSKDKFNMNLDGKINAILSGVVTQSFFANTLEFNSNIWDLAKTGLPKLKNLDTNNITTVTEKTEIRTIEDFLKINEAPDKYYELKNDLDFSNYKLDRSSVISTTFTGKFNGAGHTISNLENLSLFANFRGTVENLNIKNVSNTGSGRGSGDYVTAFTQESYTAKFKNMKFENITLSGRNFVAVLTGMDGRENANSIVENISVKNANVTGSGVYVSTLIGRKYGGKVSNVFVQGNLDVISTENGGLIGASQQNPVIENIVTDVSITKTRNTYGNVGNSIFNAAMIGNIYDNPVIRNAIAFGNMTGYTASDGTVYVPYKLTGASEALVIATMTNCYEVDEEIGSTRVSTNTQGKLNSISRSKLNKQFYKNLGFDEAIWNLDAITGKGYPELK